MNKDHVPIILFKNSLGYSPLDFAIEMNEQKSINVFLDMIIKFQNDPLHNYIIDHHLCEIIEKGIDLKEYF